MAAAQEIYEAILADPDDVDLRLAYADAVRRRLANELNLPVGDLVPLLPDFRYWAELDGVVENEICPVFGAVTDAEPVPNPAEVEAVRWVPWDDVLAGTLEVDLSPWCLLQLEQLAGLPALSSLLPSGSAPR
jgi:isopentenyl-diphosphate delta-isomerase